MGARAKTGFDHAGDRVYGMFSQPLDCPTILDDRMDGIVMRLTTGVKQKLAPD
jgi:hypothetical protein